MTPPNPLAANVIAALTLICGMASNSSPVRSETPLVVFAASSVTNVVEALESSFERSHGVEVIVSFAASSVLARQINDGAPAHVFISASQAWMAEVLRTKAVSPDSVRTIAQNRLALIVPSGTLSSMTSDMAELDGEVVSAVMKGDLPFAIGNPDHVPAGIYAKQALQYLGVWENIKPRLAPMPNVRSVLATVIRGEVSGGIVYASDAQSTDGVRKIGVFPASSHVAIQYPAARTQGDNHYLADTFLEFLVSPEAERVFKEFGFLPPPS